MCDVFGQARTNNSCARECEDVVDANVEKIRTHADLCRQLTEREVAILAVATADLEARGWHPYEEAFYIQVAPRFELVANTSPEDQSFKRQTFHKAKPAYAPCLLPRSKLVLTSEWRLIGSKDLFKSSSSASFQQEKMLLQGVGLEEFRKYHMEKLSPAQLSNMVGNALPRCHLVVLARQVLSVCLAFLVSAHNA